MTILQELVGLYERQASERNWPEFGFSTESIGAAVVLKRDGAVRTIRSMMAPDEQGKLRPRKMPVPRAVTRTSGIKPNTFWDKSAYVLGVTETENGPGQAKRTLAEHDAFREWHLALLESTGEEALIALRRFCDAWMPESSRTFPMQNLSSTRTLSSSWIMGRSCTTCRPHAHCLPKKPEIRKRSAW